MDRTPAMRMVIRIEIDTIAFPTDVEPERLVEIRGLVEVRDSEYESMERMDGRRARAAGRSHCRSLHGILLARVCGDGGRARRQIARRSHRLAHWSRGYDNCTPWTLRRTISSASFHFLPLREIDAKRVQIVIERIADRHHAERPPELDDGQMAEVAFVHDPQRVKERLVGTDRLRLGGHDVCKVRRIRI